METLRAFLSDAHQRGLSGLSVLMDTSIADPQLEERLHRIRTHVMCAVALRTMLTGMGFGGPTLSERLDLAPLIELAQTNGVLNRRERGILWDLNTMANEAKHDLVFRSRL